MSTELIYCESCGTKLTAGAQFCRSCGSAQPDGAATPVVVDLGSVRAVVREGTAATAARPMARLVPNPPPAAASVMAPVAIAAPVLHGRPYTPERGAIPYTPQRGAIPCTPERGAIPCTPERGAIPYTPEHRAIPTPAPGMLGSDWLIVVLAIGLVLDLALAPWFSLGGLLHLSGPTQTATAATLHRWLAFAAAGSAGVVVLGVLMDVAGAAQRIITRIAALAALTFAGTKLGLDLHEMSRLGLGTRLFGFGAWLSVIIGVVMLLVAVLPSAHDDPR